MGRISLSEAPAGFSCEEKTTLVELARESIRRGLCGEVFGVQTQQYAVALRTPRASFVTLRVERSLRGCIGSLEARRPLVEDVVENAHAAAFRDPRFPALTWPEFERLVVHLSILSAPEALAVGSEAQLLARLCPGVDGLILEEGLRRGTFLPSVWEQLPEPREFLRSLKLKVGFGPDYWSGSIRVQRYTVESIP